MSDMLKNKAMVAAISVEPFVPNFQWRALITLCKGDRADHYHNVFVKLSEQILSIPAVDSQTGKGDETTVYLHYTKNITDLYIIERDIEDGDCEPFGYGYAVVNDDVSDIDIEFISIPDFIKRGFQLDLSFKPSTWGEVKAKHASCPPKIVLHP